MRLGGSYISNALPYEPGGTGCSVVAVGKYLYIFGFYSFSSNYVKAIKIDSETYEITNLTNLPFTQSDTYNGTVAEAVGTNIYIFRRGNANDPCVYKYDTLTDEYTVLLSSTLYSVINTKPHTVVGNDIYITNSSGYIYKYNTTNNTYARIKSFPYSLVNNGPTSCTAVGTDIYFFGSRGSEDSYKKKAYKYDTLTDTYTELPDLPINTSYEQVISVGSIIYIFNNGNSVNNEQLLKYDTILGTYTQLTDSEYSLGGNSPGCGITKINNKIFIVGPSNTKNIGIFNIIDKTFDNNSIVISQGFGKYYTNLINTEINGLKYFFWDAWPYTTANGLDDTIPTYYGNGTQWIKFKN